jgi:hypothetical protein
VESERCLVLVAWLIDKRKISGNCFSPHCPDDPVI